MLKIAFVDKDGIIQVNAEAKSVALPQFMRDYDTDTTIGQQFTRPVARSIQAAELTIGLKDHKKNPAFLRFIESAFNLKLIVTLMILEVEMKSPTLATSDAEFYSGFVSRPGRSISPDKADDGEITMQISDSWRTENGIVVWRLPTGAADAINIALVYG